MILLTWGQQIPSGTTGVELNWALQVQPGIHWGSEKRTSVTCFLVRERHWQAYQDCDCSLKILFFFLLFPPPPAPTGLNRHLIHSWSQVVDSTASFLQIQTLIICCVTNWQRRAHICKVSQCYALRAESTSLKQVLLFPINGTGDPSKWKCRGWDLSLLLPLRS